MSWTNTQKLYMGSELESLLIIAVLHPMEIEHKKFQPIPF